MRLTYKHPSLMPSITTYPLPVERFTWNKQTARLVAEASDFQNFQIQPVFNDSCDVGISIYSKQTDVCEIFTLSSEDTNDEGEVQGWNFVPLNKNCPVRRVLIIND